VLKWNIKNGVQGLKWNKAKIKYQNEKCGQVRGVVYVFGYIYIYNLTTHQQKFNLINLIYQSS